MTNVKVGERYQVVVPKEARRALGLKPGDRLQVEVIDGAVVMRPAMSQAAALFGRDKAIWSGVDAVTYVREERSSWRD